MRATRFRSMFERDLAAQIKNKTGTLRYEDLKLSYQRPPATYTPDFVLPNGIIIESKGRFTAADRTKMLLIKRTYPELDIRLVFQNPNVKLTKSSPTTYGTWATKHGFIWASRWVPQAWFEEPEKNKKNDNNNT